MASKQFIYQSPLPEVVDQLKSVPWALKLFSDPTLRPFTNESRIIKTTHTGDTFVARTLATEDTIPVWQSFHKLPAPGTESNSETITVAKIGSGVNGHIDTCHGGFVGVLLDEVIGTTADNTRPHDKHVMTAYIKVDYKAPIRTPSVVLCRAWIEKKEGKKMYGRGTVEDGEGKVLALGDALFIIVPKIEDEGWLATANHKFVTVRNTRGSLSCGKLYTEAQVHGETYRPDLECSRGGWFRNGGNFVRVSWVWL